MHVVRAFESDVVPHPDGSVDPLRDAQMLELELILADLAAVERRLERLEANIKKANRAEDVAERALFLKMKEALEAERPLRAARASARTSGAGCATTAFLSEKPVLLVVNLGEDAGARTRRPCSRSRASRPSRPRPGFALCPVSAPIEAEMAQLSAEDARPSARTWAWPSRASTA